MDSFETQELVPKPPTNPLEESLLNEHGSQAQKDPCGRTNLFAIILKPFQWLLMFCREVNTSFVFGIFLVYGLIEGVSRSFFEVVSDFYWKDVQNVQPYALQLCVLLYYIPMKPVWGILTDEFPVRGYRRRPYFVLAGVLGTISALTVATYDKLPIAFALTCLIGIKAGITIAEVTIDACVERKSIEIPSLAKGMQRLCGVCSSMGAVMGCNASGMFVHHLGAQGAMGLLAVPPALVVLLGFLIYEPRTNHDSEKKAVKKGLGAAMSGLYQTIKSPQMWKPSLYMYLSLAIDITTHEGFFYWYTNPKAGPAFSQELLGVMYGIGVAASLWGIVIYQKLLKDYPIRNLLFFTQLLYGISGMIDLMFVLRWNLKLGIPDYYFMLMKQCVTLMIGEIRWMPMVTLSKKLCPLGTEGTFSDLFLWIDSLGFLSSKLGCSMVLRLLHVTRTDFTRLWLAVLIRNMLRIATLALIFLVPHIE